MFSEELFGQEGKMIPLENVKDKVFSSKLMRDGIIFEFSDDTLSYYVIEHYI